MSRKRSGGIRQTDPPKTPKVWEKARREKMKIYFNELQEVLPLYDPSAPMSRFEILQKSRMYIKELQSQNQDLLNGGFDEVFKNKMEKLKQRVKELLQRVDQLTDLLRRANIMIPPLVPCPGKHENTSLSQRWMNQRPKKWTEKINVIVPDEKIENILSLIKNFKKKSNKINVGKKNCKTYENTSENKVQNGSLVENSITSESVELKKKKELKKITTSKIIVSDASSSKDDKNGSDSFTDSPSHTKENQPVDFNLPVSDELPEKVSECNDVDKTNQNKSGSVEKIFVQSKVDTKSTDNDEKINGVTEKVKNVIEPQNNVFLPVSNNVMQSNTYLLTNDGNLVHFPILNSSGNMFGANSNLLTQTAIVNQQNSGLLTPLVINGPSPVIVLQKPGPQLIQATQIVNPTPQILSVPNPNIQILSNSIVCATSSQNSNSKTLPYILSKQPANKKRLAKDSTMTTYVNKIPIPALSKQSYVKKAISVNNCIGTKGKNFQYKVRDGKEKLTKSEKSNVNESESEVSVNEKEIQTDKCTEVCTQENDTGKEKDKEIENTMQIAESSAQKRSIADEDVHSGKKQKVTNENSDENFFKPIIENPIVPDPPASNDSLFCNLKLPNSVTHNLSVSPTAAFLSTFPIVATSKFEVEDEITAKIIERRPCEEKNVGLTEDKETKRKGLPAEPSENIQDSHTKNCDLSEMTKVILPNKESQESSKFANEDKVINSNTPVGKSNSDINTVNESLNTTISRNSINNVSTTAITTANSSSSSSNNNNNSSNSNNNTSNSNSNNNNNHNNNNNNNTMTKESNKNCSSNNNCNNNINNNNNNNHCSKNSNNTSNSNNNDNNNIAVSDALCSQLVDVNKSWHDYNHNKNCDIRTDPFYIHSEIVNSVPSPAITNVLTSTLTSFTDTAVHNSAIYKISYSQNNMKTNFDDQNTINEQIPLKNNQFDYAQKENFINKRMVYNGERQMMKKLCTNNLNNDTYSLSKNPTDMYQADSNINYQLIPTKEISNQRNSRPPVNWMTDPDVRSRSMTYGPQSEKMTSTKIPPFNQPDIFCMNNQSAKSQSDVPTDYVLSDMNKMNYQKNEYYMNKNVDAQMKQPDQRCKNVDKRSESKFPSKSTQNSYNIFDYNYNGNYFGDDETNKFCSLQNFPCNTVKNKKGNSLGVTKKKADAPMHLISNDQHPNDSVKRNSEHLSNMDFNSVGNQECFSWVPGKNVDWLPSKSFVDNNLILPSTLPTLVGDLALGTTTSSEIAQTKGNGRINQTKTSLESGGKSYIDLGLCNNAPFPKPLDTAASDKQYLEPFTNLSKNIFDLTPSNNVQNSQLLKADCEKNGYVGNANETIVLKNIFELPVSKSFTNDFANRNKQRNVNNTQNTFLSVSQLVETPNYENSAIKAETPMENGVAKPSDSYAQNYSGYHGSQKAYKNKNRNPHYKYNDRKYLGYKNTSSNYTAEALIRSNANLSYQTNEFQTEVNSNFYNMKNPQKPDNFLSGNKNDFESISKTDFAPCSTQNIYADFNFSSPVPNFNISTSVSTDYIGHDGNFSSQNNSFFGDFIPPEYPITESVSNSLLLPPCSIGLQNPFIIEKRNATPEKGGKSQGKTYSNSRSRKNFDCSKTSYNDFSIVHNSSAGIFTNAAIACPTIFTTTSCQNLLPVPNQNISDPNITFSAPSFTTANIPFPTLTCNGNANYHRSANALPNSTAATFFPSTCHSMFTTCSTTTVISSRACTSTVPAASSSSAVITTSFSVGSAHFPSSTQSSLPILSLSNPIIPSSVPSTSGNSLANFNLSTIFPEINQKGNYHYP